MPSGLQAPPPNVADEVIVRIEVFAPLKSTLFSPSLLTKPRERPSGDQNGRIALSVPGSFCAVKESTGRSHSADPPFESANAMRLPSGDTATSRASAINGGEKPRRATLISGALRVKYASAKTTAVKLTMAIAAIHG